MWSKSGDRGPEEGTELLSRRRWKQDFDIGTGVTGTVFFVTKSIHELRCLLLGSCPRETVSRYV
jgi:hypothetical protein